MKESSISKKLRKETLESFCEYLDEKYAIEVEEGIFDFTKQYCSSNVIYLSMALGIYREKREDLLFNFSNNNKSIRNIKKRIKKGVIHCAYNMAFYTPEELDEEAWEHELHRRRKNQEVMENIPTVEWKPCRDCKCTKYEYRELQTRSADEPMTIFYICKGCGKTVRGHR